VCHWFTVCSVVRAAEWRKTLCIPIAEDSALDSQSGDRLRTPRVKKSFPLLFVTLALLIGSTTAQPEQSPLPVSTDEVELLRLEKVWNEAHLLGDAKPLARLWDDDLVVVVPKMKLINKTEALSMFGKGRMSFLRYETSDLSVKIHGDTAIVLGRLVRTRTMGNRELQDDWRFSKVYIRRAGAWRVVLWQASDF
jgi:ketosteroid isomerase-like protein